jgi:tetrahydromethanopterin S-methyltransferase subunit D
MMAKSPPPPEFDVPLVAMPNGRMAVVWWEWLQRYIRWDEACCEAAGGGGGGGGVPEAPLDGGLYARGTEEGQTDTANWIPIVPSEEVVTEAPQDGNIYNRIDADWQIATFVEQAGDTMTGPLVLYGNPQAPLEAASKQYVDYLPPLAHTHPESDIVNLTIDLAAKAPLASPTFTGIPAAPTAVAGTNTTQLATTAFVMAAIAAAKLVEPPNDNKAYARQNSAWAVISGTVSTIGEWMFNNTLSIPPASSQIRMDQANQQLATRLYISTTTSENIDVGVLLRLQFTVGTRIMLQDKDEATRYVVYRITANTAYATYMDVGVTFLEMGQPLAEQRVMLTVLINPTSAAVLAELSARVAALEAR